MDQYRLQKLLESELVKPFMQQHPAEPSELKVRDTIAQNKPSGLESWLDDWHDPHEVGLKNFYSGKNDAKTLYYTNLEPLMGANPYMPVVYNIDQFGDKNNSRMEFKLERLISFGQADLVQLISCFKRVFFDLGEQENGKYTSQLDALYEKVVNSSYDSTQHDDDVLADVKSDVEYFYQKIVDLIQDEVDSPHRSTGMLKQFIEQLSKFVHQHQRRGIMLRYDLHRGNFMFRKTNNGLQLVFNDPVIEQDM